MAEPPTTQHWSSRCRLADTGPERSEVAQDGAGEEGSGKSTSCEAAAGVSGNESGSKWRGLPSRIKWDDSSIGVPAERSASKFSDVVLSARGQFKSQSSAAKFTATQAHLVHDRDTKRMPRTYKDTMKVADARDRLLSDARRYSPISLVLMLNKLPQTVIVRLACFPVVWILVVTYALVATLCRMGLVELGEPDPYMYNGGSVLVTFMVVFYLGYCYNRHFMIYETARGCSSTILSICVAARAFHPQNERRKLFMYVHAHLLHLAPFTSSTHAAELTTTSGHHLGTYLYYTYTSVCRPQIPESDARVSLLRADPGLHSSELHGPVLRTALVAAASFGARASVWCS